MKKKANLKRKLNRVDYQVSLIIAFIVSLSFLCVYFYNYQTTYNDMLYTLKERSDNIYDVVENEFNRATFNEINDRSDVEKEIYLKDKKLLEYIKDSTGVRYLYTAKRTDNGEFIYVLDGLSSDSSDFRYPGDFIEMETIPELEQAYRNEVVYPDDIKNTSWGKIFVSYYPIHDNEEVIGVIGIEFDAQHQFDTFEKLRIMTPIIGGIFAVVAIVISVYLFRRISNPLYHDFANSDYLTGVKNRNAFEILMSNLEVKGKEHYAHYGFISIDLNDLKVINDSLGHQTGDRYIKECAGLLKQFESEEIVLYRIGGDEFILLLSNTDNDKIAHLTQQIIKIFDQYNNKNAKDKNVLSIAIGYAVYDTQDISLQATLNRADNAMYNRKKEMKNQFDI